MKLRTLLLGSALAVCAAPALAGKAFVTNERGNTITVVNTDTWEVETEFFAGNRPRGITVSPDGTKIYVCASDDNLVRVFDAQTYEELPSLPSGPDPELFIIEPSGKRLYIANEDDNLVTVTDTETRTILAEVPVGVEPEGMGMSPDAKWVVNTSETTNMAHFISTEDYTIKHNVLVDQRPRYAQYTADGSRLVMAISEEPVTFHEFGRFFRDALGLPQALYLDGNVSRLHAPSLGRSDFGRAMGPILGVVAPRG